MREFIKSVNRPYVYALCRPSGIPFYIGKGRNNRLFNHASEARQGKRLHQSNPHKNNIFRKIWRENCKIIYALDSIHDNDTKAIRREAELIEKFKRFCDGGCLSNLSPGANSSRQPDPLSIQRSKDTLSGTPKNRPERATLNEYLQSIGPVKSVCIKPLVELKLQHSTPHPQPRKPSLRSAYALIASAAANELRIDTGIEIPRKFEFEGIVGVLENGVCRDILKSSLATLIKSSNPADEKFSLNSIQKEKLITLYGIDKLKKMELL